MVAPGAMDTGDDVSVSNVRIKSLNPGAPLFDGTNPEDLSRLIALSKLELSFASSDNEEDRTAWLGQHFEGAALDWLEHELQDDATILSDFDEFVAQAKLNFGITDDVLTSRWQVQLDALKWGADTPTFLSEFDRLTRKLGLTTQEVRLQLLRGKLPATILSQWADQAYILRDYAEVRNRLLTSHALRPGGLAAQGAQRAARPKCGNCGKRGHSAAQCRKGK